MSIIIAPNATGAAPWIILPKRGFKSWSELNLWLKPFKITNDIKWYWAEAEPTNPYR